MRRTKREKKWYQNIGDDHPDSARDYLLFSIEGNYFAVILEEVDEVLEQKDYTQIPNATKDFMGIFNLRGKTVGAVSLSDKFNYRNFSDQTSSAGSADLSDKVSNQEKHSLLLFHTEEGLIAAAVDEVLSVLPLNENMIDQKPKIKSRVRQEFITGVANINQHMVTIIQLKKILTSKDLITIKHLKAG